MKVTVMGHAGSLVEAAGRAVLVDPVLRAGALGSGSVVHSLGRALDRAQMPRPDLVVLTHGHLDHFDPASLASLDRATPVVAPHDRALLAELSGLGFGGVRALAPWEKYELGGLGLVATPSHSGVDEVGVVFCEGGARFWNMTDAEPRRADAARLRAELGAVSLVAAKFQPATPAHGVFRGLGPWFDKRAVVEWLEAACEVGPRRVFPYASGVRYAGPHAWLNDYVFPFRGAEAAALLRERLGDGADVDEVAPGDEIEVTEGGTELRRQASAFIRHTGEGEGEPSWRPFDASTLRGLSSGDEAGELRTRLEALFRDEVGPWVADRVKREGSPIRRYREYGVVYQLVVHCGAKGGLPKLAYAIDFTSPRLTLSEGEHPRANYFTHLSGRSLLDVLAGRSGPELFYMSGDARFYEKIVGVRDGALWAPPLAGWPLFEALPDLVTHFLRHTRPSC